jgi:cysteine desulfurase/selenocysteine lyase
MHRALDPGVYLNDAATSWPKAPGVTEVVSQAMRQAPLHPGRGLGPAVNVIDRCRGRLATLLGGVPKERIALAPNATHALNLALRGLVWRPGTRAVTTVTEHNSVLRPLHLLQDRGDLDLTVIGLDGSLGIDEDAYERALAEEPGLVVINHASNVTGRVNDVATLFARAKRVGATTVLDASQTLGVIPVHPERLHADLVAFTGHKGLRGPTGTGGLYVKSGIELEPLVVGATGVNGSLLHHPDDMPTRLEAGSPNLPALAGLARALAWVLDRAPEESTAVTTLGDRLREELAHSAHVRLFDGGPGPTRLGIVSFQIGGWTVEAAGTVLWENFGICCRTGLHCAPLIHRTLGSSPQGTIRFSLSPFTTEEQAAAAVAAVRSIAT